MSCAGIFKKSFLEGFANTEITIYVVITSLMITSVLALYIFFVYRVVTRKTFYSKSFNISLAGVSVITAAIILTIQSSIVVSLGMVGALSIVRFRTAVKDPVDLMFLFWSICVGITCGAGLAEIGVVLSLILTVGIVILSMIPVAKAPMILVVNSKNLDAEDQIMEEANRYAKHPVVKSRNMTGDYLDLTIELRTSEGKELVRKIIEIDGVTSANLLSHDGEVTF